MKFCLWKKVLAVRTISTTARRRMPLSCIRKWDKQRVIDLFGVLDWLIKLPDDMNRKLYHEIEIIEENENVKYVTSVERIGIAKGLEKGRVEGEYRLLRRQLERRFGVLPE